MINLLLLLTMFQFILCLAHFYTMLFQCFPTQDDHPNFGKKWMYNISKSQIYLYRFQVLFSFSYKEIRPPDTQTYARRPITGSPVISPKTCFPSNFNLAKKLLIQKT